MHGIVSVSKQIWVSSRAVLQGAHTISSSLPSDDGLQVVAFVWHEDGEEDHWQSFEPLSTVGGTLSPTAHDGARLSQNV